MVHRSPKRALLSPMTIATLPGAPYLCATQGGEGEMVWLYLCKDRMQGYGKKLKLIRYGPFNISDRYGMDAFKLYLPACGYTMVNLYNMKPLLARATFFDLDDPAHTSFKGMEEDTMLDVGGSDPQG